MINIRNQVRISELEFLLSKLVFEFRHTPPEHIVNYANLKNRIDELKLEYQERTGKPYQNWEEKEDE